MQCTISEVSGLTLSNSLKSPVPARKHVTPPQATRSTKAGKNNAAFESLARLVLISYSDVNMKFLNS